MKLGSINSYSCRIAKSDQDVTNVLALRKKCFPLDEEALGKVDIDTSFSLLMVENGSTGELVCTFRFKIFDSGTQIDSSYSAQFYNLEKLKNFKEPMLEIGRLCTGANSADPNILRTAWSAISYLIEKHKIGLVFGCSSFEGCNEKIFEPAFTLLKENHLAPKDFSPTIKATEVFPFAKKLHLTKADQKKALSVLPPLLRIYLTLGAWVSDHAVVDNQLNTLHVFTGLEVSSIPKNRLRLFNAGALQVG